DRHLAGGGADEAHGREALLAAGGGQAGGRADEDQDGDQQGSGDDGQDQLHPTWVVVAGRTLGGGLEAADLVDRGRLGEFGGVVADDDDQRAGGRQRVVADGAHLAAGVAVGQLRPGG